MPAPFLKLEEPPALLPPGHPICAACLVETHQDDIGWVCPSCGTVWPGDKVEASPEQADLYEEWSGEKLEGPTIPNYLAHLVTPSLSPEILKTVIMHLIETQPLTIGTQHHG